MLFAIIFAIYLLMGLALMHISFWYLSKDRCPTDNERDAILWWSWLWPYMCVRSLVKKVLSWT